MVCHNGPGLLSSPPLLCVAQHGYVKTAVRSFIKLAQKRCQKLGRELPKWCSKAGKLFFSSFPASCRVSSDAMVALCLIHCSEQGVVLGQWCRTRLLLCSTQNGRFFPSRSWMDGLFLATLRSTGSTYRRTGS